MAKVLFTKDNIKYVQLNKARLHEAVDVGKRSFFVDETVCKALDLKNNTTATNELEELFVKAAKDGVSVIAIDTTTGSVVAVSFNKLQAKVSPDIEYYQQYSDRCKDNASKAFLSFMIGTDLVVDMFEYCKSDCYLEIMFLGVLSSYRGRSIAYNLCKASENVAKILYSGENIKESITEVPLELQPFPKFVSAIFTSPVSQKIGRKLEMEVAASVELNQWTYNGKTFADILGNNPAPIQYCCKML